MEEYGRDLCYRRRNTSLDKTVSNTVDTIKMDLKLGLEVVYWRQFAAWRAAVPSMVKLRFE